MIRPATAEDAAAICEIYNHYIANTVITFEENPVSIPQMERRISAAHSSGLPWIVDEDAGRVVGYAYASPWAERSAYRFSLETSIYLDCEAIGQGRGARLFGQLLELMSATGAHAALARIALPNPGSVALHERFGFSKVGHLSEVGLKFEQWVDVGIWETRL